MKMKDMNKKVVFEIDYKEAEMLLAMILKFIPRQSSCEEWYRFAKSDKVFWKTLGKFTDKLDEYCNS